MSFNTVAQLKDGVAGILSGIDLDTVPNVNVSIQRAARMISAKLSVPDASLSLPYLIYDGVTDYAAPGNIFGGSFTDFRPQGASRDYSDYVYRKQVEDFDRTKKFVYNGVNLVLQSINGVPIIRVVSARASKRAVIDTMSAIGNWKVFGNASSLIVDSTLFYQSPAALAFNLAAAGTQGGITETLTNPMNLTSYAQTGVIFIAVYLPSAAAAAQVTSIGVQIGSSSANYYNVSNTQAQIGSFQGNLFMLVPLPLSSATVVGTPNIASIAYAKVIINYTGAAIPNVRVGNLFISLPSPYELLYQSAAIFLPQSGSNTGVPQQSITTDNDQIMLSDDIYNIYEQEAALAVAIGNGASLSEPIVININTVLNGTRTRTGLVVTYGLYDLYRAKHPSEEIPTVGSYYL